MSAILLIGWITWYAGPYVGEPLRCGGVYDESYTDGLAVDLDAYPEWRCGDLVRVTVPVPHSARGISTAFREELLLRVRDSGPLSRYCIEEGEVCREIVADLPVHVWRWGEALSVEGEVWNVTAGLRRIGAMDGTEDRQERVYSMPQMGLNVREGR